MDRSGNPAIPQESWWNTTQGGWTFDYHLKSVVGQSRVAYAFARAFQVTGDDKYLECARHALAFLYTKGWDSARGGWRFSTDQSGNVAPWPPPSWQWDPNTFRWGYAQLYPLVGIGAMLEATVGKRFYLPIQAPPAGSDYDWYVKGLKLLSDRLWDSRPDYLGYYEQATIDWSSPTGKGFSATVDGVTTSAAPATHLLWDEQVKRRFHDLADAANHRLIAKLDDPGVQFGYPEFYDSQWNVDSTRTSGDVGHMLKLSWTQGRAFMTFGESEFREGSTKVMRAVLDRGGYDFVNGGPYLRYDWATGAITHGKDYVAIEQAILAGLVNYHFAKAAVDRQDGLKMADQTLEFFLNHFVDWEMGGHYFQTDDVGNVTNPLKGDVFEQGYHSTELAYYLYVYGSVFLKKEPFSLYYRFAPSEHVQVVKLEPADLEPGALEIVKVMQDGHRFHGAVVGTALLLPPGGGGKLRVTFAPTRR